MELEKVIYKIGSIALNGSSCVFFVKDEEESEKIEKVFLREIPGSRLVVITSNVSSVDDLAKKIAGELGPVRDAVHLEQVLRRKARNGTLIVRVMDKLETAEPEVFPWLRALGQGYITLIFMWKPESWKPCLELAYRCHGSSFGNDLYRSDMFLEKEKK